MNPIIKNAVIILKESVERELDWIPAESISELTSLSSKEINDAADYLESRGFARVERAMGTHPYNFVMLQILAEGRVFYYDIIEKHESEPTQNEITGTLSKKLRPSITTNSIFIVHGHDHGIKETVARFVEKIGFNPIILHEQPNHGRHLLEKLHDYSNVGYAIVLLTPDDIGKTFGGDEKYQLRARQNVILELGYFIGKLGSERVCPIFKAPLEIPSDYVGIAFVEFDSRGAWRMELVRELKSLGYQIKNFP